MHNWGFVIVRNAIKIFLYIALVDGATLVAMEFTAQGCTLVSCACATREWVQVPSRVTHISQLVPRYYSEEQKLSLVLSCIRVIDGCVFKQIAAQWPLLQELDLGANMLAVLPKEIGLLKRVQKIALYFNHLSKLTTQIGKLSNLQELDLEHNGLYELPLAALAQLPQLRCINVADNPLITLPTWPATRARLQAQHPGIMIIEKAFFLVVKKSVA